MILKAIPVKEFDFTPYGTYYDLISDPHKVSHSVTPQYSDHMTKQPLIDTLGNLGYTIGSAAPYCIGSMEKHPQTQEALFCMAEPIVLCVALSKGDKPPHAEDVRALLLFPGEAVVLNRLVWHDACRGLGKSAGYYYLAKAGEQPAVWQVVEGERIDVTF